MAVLTFGYFMAYLFQRGSDELLPSGITYGPFTMSSSTPATGMINNTFCSRLANSYLPGLLWQDLFLKTYLQDCSAVC